MKKLSDAEEVVVRIPVVVVGVEVELALPIVLVHDERVGRAASTYKITSGTPPVEYSSG